MLILSKKHYVILTDYQQNDIISLCQKLDENNIYHYDPNPLNLI